MGPRDYPAWPTQLRFVAVSGRSILKTCLHTACSDAKEKIFVGKTSPRFTLLYMLISTATRHIHWIIPILRSQRVIPFIISPFPSITSFCEKQSSRSYRKRDPHNPAKENYELPKVHYFCCFTWFERHSVAWKSFPSRISTGDGTTDHPLQQVVDYG